MNDDASAALAALVQAPGTPAPADGAQVPLEDMGVLEVTGTDAASFLNGQFSSDVARLGAGEACLTSYSDARGRVLAIPRVLATAAGFWLALPTDRLEPVRQQLSRYVLRADVRIEACRDACRCLGIAGTTAARALEPAGTLPDEPWGTSPLGADATLVRLPGEPPRWLALGSPPAIDALQQSLDSQAARATPDTWRLLDVATGLPQVHSATAGRFVAQMLNLDRLGALDFRKGCYPGQEVIARTRYLGRIKRRMYVLHSAGTDVAAPGSPVYAGDETAGEVVEAAAHPQGGQLALAVLRLEHAAGSLAIGAPDAPAASASVPPYGFDEPE